MSRLPMVKGTLAGRGTVAAEEEWTTAAIRNQFGQGVEHKPLRPVRHIVYRLLGNLLESSTNS